MKTQIQGISEKMLAQHRMTKSLLTLLKDFDHRLESLKKILIRADACTEAEFEEYADELRGLRLKTAGQPIAVGDVVWVAYRASIDGGGDVAGEDNIPIRVGSGSIVFEPGLVGHFTGEEGVKYYNTIKEGPNKGKQVCFEINIGKVKTLINPDKEEEELDGPVESELGGRPEVEDAEGRDQPVDPGSGSGNEERSERKLASVPAGSTGAAEGGVASDETSPDSNGVSGGENV